MSQSDVNHSLLKGWGSSPIFSSRPARDTSVSRDELKWSIGHSKSGSEITLDYFWFIFNSSPGYKKLILFIPLFNMLILGKFTLLSSLKWLLIIDCKECEIATLKIAADGELYFIIFYYRTFGFVFRFHFHLMANLKIIRNKLKMSFQSLKLPSKLTKFKISKKNSRSEVSFQM